MRHRFLSRSFCLLLALAACSPDVDSGAPLSAPPAYKVGDRLPAQGGGAQAASSYREITWDELIPPDWDVAEIFAGLNLDGFQDADPRADAALRKMRQAWDNAPVNPALQGAAIRIPGFVVPLDADGNALREFLLVPYFGGCIHVPPPPANQIIHIIAQPPLEDVQAMDAIWVSGTLDAAAYTNSQMGNAGYRMQARRAEPYQWGTETR
ncbi:MAG: DUF3299 domain-containing protein [Zoogloeaceae bacterium]|jgi:hypothetical protein|nr:DUF3299 domain-containing protein [Zoogloeaceae bacterium]